MEEANSVGVQAKTSKPSTKIILAIIVITSLLTCLVLSCSFIAYTQLVKDSDESTESTTDNDADTEDSDDDVDTDDEEEEGDSETPAPDPAPTPSISLTKKCMDDVSGITLMLPSTWTCKANELKASPGDILIQIGSADSAEIGITISNLGRGGPCGDPGQTCTKTTFYDNDVIKLTEYSGDSNEIFGTFKETASLSESGSAYISVTYKNMESQDLSDANMEIFKAVMDSITY